MNTPLVILRLPLIVTFGITSTAKLRDTAGSRNALRDFGVPASAGSVLGALALFGELRLAASVVPASSASWRALAAWCYSWHSSARLRSSWHKGTPDFAFASGRFTRSRSGAMSRSGSVSHATAARRTARIVVSMCLAPIRLLFNPITTKEAIMALPANLRAVTVWTSLAFASGPIVATAEPTIKWTPHAVSVALPPGSSQNVLVTFVSATDLIDVRIDVVPGLAPFVTPSPATIPLVKAGIQYDVRVRVDLPSSAIPETSLDGVLRLHQGSAMRVVPQPLPVAVVVTAPKPVAASDITLFSEPTAPELLSFKASDGSLVTFYGTKDPNAITTSVTSAILQTPAPNPQRYFTIFGDGRPTGFVTPDGHRFGFEWTSDTQVVVSVVTPDGEVQAKHSFTLPLPQTATVAIVPQSQQLTHSSTSASLSSLINSADLIVATLTANVTACGDPVSGALTTAAFTAALSGSTYGGVMDEISPGVYQRQFPNFPAAIDPTTIENSCTAIVEPIENVCNVLQPDGAPSLSNFMTDGGGCLALAVDAGVLGGPGVAAGVLAACVAIFKTTDTACGLAKADALCSDISAVHNLFDPDGVHVEVTAQATGFAPATNSLDIPGSTTAASVDVALSGPPTVQFFSTTPIDPAPFQGYVATANLTCLGPQMAITLSISGTDGYTQSDVCGAGVNVCSMSVPGGAAGVVDTISVSVGASVLRTIQLVF